MIVVHQNSSDDRNFPKKPKANFFLNNLFGDICTYLTSSKASDVVVHEKYKSQHLKNFRSRQFDFSLIDVKLENTLFLHDKKGPRSWENRGNKKYLQLSNNY